ncbi:unnamed protein product [Pleuronectes platessa]|uniref:Uncharacterized protein n=1 Tax=Pleuronectes platessa TaxID=8262 RepID=A0A9N7UD48_PLEPL|nr:unnamed protein product [Pleuronectes platessa]
MGDELGASGAGSQSQTVLAHSESSHLTSDTTQTRISSLVPSNSCYHTARSTSDGASVALLLGETGPAVFPERGDKMQRALMQQRAVKSLPVKTKQIPSRLAVKENKLDAAC